MVSAACVIVAIGLLSFGVAAQDSTVSSLEARLLTQAQTSGTVRVIVGIAAPDAPVSVNSDPLAELAHQRAINASRDTLLADIASFGTANVKAESRAWVIPFAALEVDATALAALIADARVTSIEEDVAETIDLAQTIPIINADDFWGLGFNGAGYTVAVLDTGTTSTHSAFGGRVVAEACYSTDNADGNSICPNGLTSQTGSGAASPTPCLTAFGSGAGCEHGTNVTGIAAGSDATILGVGRGASIIAVQVFSYIFAFSGPLAYISDQVSGMNYVYSLRDTYRIAAVNLSLGGGFNTSACDASQASRAAIFATLRSAGIVPVVATGNNSYDNGIGAPACISTAVAVGATTDADARASFSNSLVSLVTLMAPGVSVYSAFPTGYGSMSGTSQATPHVAGAFALLRQAVPGLSDTTYINALRNSGVAITVPGGTSPRIDLTAARLNLLSGARGIILTVPLQGHPAAPNARLGKTHNVRVVRTSDSAVITNTAIQVDFNARTTTLVPTAATYRVRVKGAHTLAETANVAVGASIIALTLPTLREGDANNDNVVNISDFSLLAASFGTAMGGGSYNPNADFNDDGAVNITDFSLLAASFGQVGAAL